MSVDGELFQQVLYGNKPTQKGLLEDYAFVLNMLIETDQVTHDKEYLLQVDCSDKVSRYSRVFSLQNPRWADRESRKGMEIATF
jgi:hypothetical protein